MIGKTVILLLLVTSLAVSSAHAAKGDPADLIHFDSSDKSNFILKGDSLITNQENPSLKLNGIGDYLILDSSLPKKLNDFTISVWVNPDYKVGTPATQSIVSQSQAFDLSINNDKIDKQIVTFSVFDGIKWHNVDSKSEIKDKWTYLTATYSNETISIFVNGVKENSVKVDGQYSYTYTHGIASQHSFDYILSESKILIGAYSPLLRADGIVNNNFSGLIDDVGLYTITLSDTKISEIYDKNRIAVFIAPVIQNVIQQEKGTPNKFGFVASKYDSNDQKIESLAFQGYKVNKQSGGFLDEPSYSEISNVNLEKTDSSKVTDSSGLSSEGTESVDTSTETDASVLPAKETKPVGPTTPEHEKTVSIGQLMKKLVRVESGSTSTFSELPTGDSEIVYNWKLYGFEKGSLVDFSNNPEVSFNLIDSNSDGIFDRADWIVINNIKDFYLISEIL